MLMQYWDHQLKVPSTESSDVSVIQQQLYSRKDRGIPASSMQQYLQQHGFKAFELHGTWNDIEQQLQKGRPLIAALKPQGQNELHYVVIDGVDTTRGLVKMNDPAERKLLSEERATFEKDWSATQNWTLLAVPAQSSR